MANIICDCSYSTAIEYCYDSETNTDIFLPENECPQSYPLPNEPFVDVELFKDRFADAPSVSKIVQRIDMPVYYGVGDGYISETEFISYFLQDLTVTGEQLCVTSLNYALVFKTSELNFSDWSIQGAWLLDEFKIKSDEIYKMNLIWWNQCEALLTQKIESEATFDTQPENNKKSTEPAIGGSTRLIRKDNPVQYDVWVNSAYDAIMRDCEGKEDEPVCSGLLEGLEKNMQEPDLVPAYVPYQNAD